MITRRLVEMAFADLDTVEDWLRRFPHLTVSRTGDTLTCRHYDGFTAGFAPLAPLDAAIALAFAVVGPQWPYALPTLIREVDAEVKRRQCHQTSGTTGRRSECDLARWPGALQQGNPSYRPAPACHNGAPTFNLEND